MKGEIDLTEEQRQLVVGLIKRHLPDTDVWAYGSRVTWTARPGSDLDLVVFSDTDHSREVSDFREALDDSNLPFRVDVSVWGELPESFRQEIDQAHFPVVEDTSHVMHLTFGECATLVRDTVDPEDMPSDMPYVGLGHIPRNGLAIINPGVASDVTSAKTRFRRGDILFGRLRPYFRKVARAQYDGICSTDIWVVRARSGIEQEYLFYQMAHRQFVDYASSASEGTRMPRAKWDHVAQYNIALPCISIQQRIAHLLRTMDEKINLIQRKMGTLDSILRTVFYGWFVTYDPVYAKAEGRDAKLPATIADAFVDSTTTSSLGSIPSGWTVKSLGDLLTLAYGRALPSRNRRHNGSIPVYGSNGQIGWHDTALVDGPGIVVGRKGTPGTVNWISTDFFPIDTAYYVVPRHHCISLFFLFFALQDQRLSLLVADSAVPGLNRDIAYAQQQVFPTARVLRLFDECVKPFFATIGHLTDERQLIISVRNLLLDQFMSRGNANHQSSHNTGSPVSPEPV